MSVFLTYFDPLDPDRKVIGHSEPLPFDTLDDAEPVALAVGGPIIKRTPQMRIARGVVVSIIPFSLPEQFDHVEQ
jgi:hypothetical protein